MSDFTQLMRQAGSELIVHTEFINPLHDGRTRHGFSARKSIKEGATFTVDKVEETIEIGGQEIPITRMRLRSGTQNLFEGDESRLKRLPKVASLLSLLARATKAEEKRLGMKIFYDTTFKVTEISPAILALLIDTGKLTETDVQAAAQVVHDMAEEPYYAMLKKYAF